MVKAPHITDDERVSVQGLTADQCYERICDWVRKNPDAMKGQVDVAKGLPLPADARLEDKGWAFQNVIAGGLENSFHETDGKVRMAAYAERGLNALETSSPDWRSRTSRLSTLYPRGQKSS